MESGWGKKQGEISLRPLHIQEQFWKERLEYRGCRGKECLCKYHGHQVIQKYVGKLADQLAKEAANEALEMAEDDSVVMLDDIKSAAKLSVRMKWEERWDASE